jgi:hypothetical protein
VVPRYPSPVTRSPSSSPILLLYSVSTRMAYQSQTAFHQKCLATDQIPMSLHRSRIGCLLSNTEACSDASPRTLLSTDAAILKHLASRTSAFYLSCMVNCTSNVAETVRRTELWKTTHPRCVIIGGPCARFDLHSPSSSLACSQRQLEEPNPISCDDPM